MEYETYEYHGQGKIDFGKTDIVYLGAGFGDALLCVCQNLCKHRQDFKRFINDGGAVVAISGGYQILGHYYKYKNERIQGAALLDIFTEEKRGRIIGNAVIKSSLFNLPIVGFENHSERTYIGELSPLGTVIRGGGNNGEDKTEGVLYKNVVATHLHGPLLPKNPHLCDYILKAALSRRFGTDTLIPLDDSAELAANAYIAGRTNSF